MPESSTAGRSAPAGTASLPRTPQDLPPMVEVGAVQRSDGTWRCACGQIEPNDISMFLHRKNIPHDLLRERMRAVWLKAVDGGGGNTPSAVIDICASVARDFYESSEDQP